MVLALLYGASFAYGTPNWKLPWTAGESWQCQCSYGCGLHTDANNAYYSVDFDKSGIAENGPDQPVLAAAAGTVTFAGLNGAYGYCVKIDHGGGYVSMYAHLRYNPTVSGSVTQGQQIGVMGGTGTDGVKTYNDHIHFMVYYNGQCKSFINESKPEPMSGYTQFAATQWYTSDNTGQTFLATQTGYSITPGGAYSPGQTIQCEVYWRNDGTATWSNQSGPEYVELGSCDANGNIVPSYLYASGLGWISDLVPCTFSAATVAPGQTATFSFQGKIPLSAQPSQVSIYFGPVYNGQIMDYWDGNGFTITVVNPSAPDLSPDAIIIVRHSSTRYQWRTCPSNGSSAFGSWRELIYDFGNDGFQFFTGDVNGDGFEDGLEVQRVNNTTMRWHVALNDGQGRLVYDGAWLGDFGNYNSTFLVGDFTGDGKCDIAHGTPVDGQPWIVRWRVAKSTGSSFASGVIWLNDFGNEGFRWFAGDFNGDGKCDIAHNHDENATTVPWHVALSTGTSFQSGTRWRDDFGNAGQTHLVGDFNGDGKCDIAHSHAYSSTVIAWKVSLSTGSGFGGSSQWHGDFGDSHSHWFAADMDHDGDCDLVQATHSLSTPTTVRWRVTKSNRSSFVGNDVWKMDFGDSDDRFLLARVAPSSLYSPKLAEPEELLAVPSNFTLRQNYPNPFNPQTTISYSLPEATHVRLDVYNILGQRVESLLDADQPAGEYQITWDAGRFASGMYFYRIQTTEAVETKKMLLVK